MATASGTNIKPRAATVVLVRHPLQAGQMPPCSGTAAPFSPPCQTSLVCGQNLHILWQISKPGPERPRKTGRSDMTKKLWKTMLDGMRSQSGDLAPGVVGGWRVHDGPPEMRVLRAWAWSKEDSVALAVYAAELVIHIYEERYPDDKRPRQAIEAAKAWLKDPNEKTRAAADAAGA